MKKIIFLTPYPHDTAGSQRFRFEQYYDFLQKENGFEIVQQSFFDLRTWSVLYKKGFLLAKVYGIVCGFIKRLLMSFRLYKYEYVFIHREAAPIGPPLLEWWIARVLKKKLIYDFDDAIWLSNTSKTNAIVSILKWNHKVGAICKWSHKVSCGNKYLVDYAKKFNSKVVFNPTTINTETRHLPSQTKNSKLVIGWTGTHSTLQYLSIVKRILNEVNKTHDFHTLIIADKKPEVELPSMIYLPWSKVSEIADLNQIDIGIMPLEDNQWALGKCGFKALQFMALEKPVLVSPVGANNNIVEHGISGFHCSTEADWKKSLITLLDNNKLSSEMGKKGRTKVVTEYSVESNKENFLALFNE